MRRMVVVAIGTIAWWWAAAARPAPMAGRSARDQRGLSQSTENALLLVGAVVVAGIIVAAVTKFVTAQMAQLH